jgi:proline iminopeptidase
MHDPSAVAPTITKDRIVADTVELIEWLRTEYKQEKVILVGLSWGSVIGLEVARTRPELLHAYVGLGQVIDFEENEKQGWAFAMERATEEGNQDAIRDLEAIAPYPSERSTPSSLYTQRKWVEYYGGAMHNRKGYGAAISSVKLSPDYTDAEVAAFLEAPDATFPILYRELMAYDASGVSTLNCPIALFLGRHDYHVVSSVSADWLARLDAPWKDLVWFENSSHVVMLEEPGRTLVELVNRVRPLASPDDKSR